MDVSSLVYTAADVMIPPRPNIFIDEEAEMAGPKPKPLREPRVIKSTHDRTDEEEPPKSPGSHPAFSPEPDDSSRIRNKHESYDLSGSVLLIAGDGRKLKLPMPSESQNDPLNWGRWKRFGAFLALGWYSVAAITIVQAASLMMHGIEADFGPEVGFKLRVLLFQITRH